MATAYVSFFRLGPEKTILPSRPRVSETVTTSGTAADTTNASREGEYVLVYCATSLYLCEKGGAASATTGFFYPGGSYPAVYGPLGDGNDISLIDV